jgi:hypothetical protein
MQKLIYKLMLVISVSVGLSACSGSSITENLETPLLQMSAEGPLYGGANSATATWEFNLKEILASEAGDISEAKITSVQVTLKASDNLPALEKMVFEVTSKNTPMTRIGLYEGTIMKDQIFDLNIASEQENLASAFSDGKMTFVGDFDLMDEEYPGNIEFILKVKFAVTRK